MKPHPMRQLATWAAGHRQTARLLVVFCYILANAAGIAFSLMVPDDPRIAAWLILGGLLLSGWCLSAYASRERDMRFRARKIRDLGLCLATLLFVTGAASQQLQSGYRSPNPVYSVHAATMPVRESTHKHQTIREKLMHAKQWFAEQSNGVKVLLIVLTVLLAAGLIYLWAAVCCGIICNGMEVLGYALFFAGAAGAIFGAFKVIQRIVRGPKTGSAKR